MSISVKELEDLMSFRLQRNYPNNGESHENKTGSEMETEFIGTRVL